VFADYINERPAFFTAELKANEALPITVPGDGIYVVAIADGDNVSYLVIYAFDTMRNVIKALLKKVFCPQYLHDCPAELKEQLKEDRLFITRVATAMATLIGIIHSERVDHFHYFSMSEARLAALQRANDILEKVLLLFGNYGYELPCNCHPA
jgi:hypothetical protein